MVFELEEEHLRCRRTECRVEDWVLRKRRTRCWKLRNEAWTGPEDSGRSRLHFKTIGTWRC